MQLPEGHKNSTATWTCLCLLRGNQSKWCFLLTQKYRLCTYPWRFT